MANVTPVSVPFASWIVGDVMNVALALVKVCPAKLRLKFDRGNDCDGWSGSMLSHGTSKSMCAVCDPEVELLPDESPTPTPTVSLSTVTFVEPPTGVSTVYSAGGVNAT